ncbi:MAG: glycerophosphodiester phosphodiesterase [Propionibacteriaceae bacterium]|nr:glycerophosphodiester phosphodiesterase [Propionibacteriaceae bacterium]
MCAGFLEPEFTAMAHRGGALLTANLGIENTLAAFANAVALGFEYLETDVHATADGQLVAFHDPNLARVTDVEGRIADLPLVAVREVRVGEREPIPTVTELLETFPDAKFNFDIKAPGATAPLADTIRRHGAEQRVCVGSFSQLRINRFRRLLPEAMTAVGPVGVAAMRLGHLRPYRPGAPGVFQIPITQQVAGFSVRLLTPSRIRAIHRAGYRIHVWTVDVPDEMHTLIDWGVDGIVTDRPDLLREALRSRGMWTTRLGT